MGDYRTWLAVQRKGEPITVGGIEMEQQKVAGKKRAKVVRFTAKEIRDIKKMYRNGYSIGAIAQDFLRDPSVIYYHTKNIKRRRKSMGSIVKQTPKKATPKANVELKSMIKGIVREVFMEMLK